MDTRSATAWWNQPSKVAKVEVAVLDRLVDDVEVELAPGERPGHVDQAQPRVLAQAPLEQHLAVELAGVGPQAGVPDRQVLVVLVPGSDRAHLALVLDPLRRPVGTADPQPEPERAVTLELLLPGGEGHSVDLVGGRGAEAARGGLQLPPGEVHDPDVDVEVRRRLLREEPGARRRLHPPGQRPVVFSRRLVPLGRREPGTDEQANHEQPARASGALRPSLPPAGAVARRPRAREVTQRWRFRGDRCDVLFRAVDARWSGSHRTIGRDRDSGRDQRRRQGQGQRRRSGTGAGAASSRGAQGEAAYPLGCSSRQVMARTWSKRSRATRARPESTAPAPTSSWRWVSTSLAEA